MRAKGSQNCFHNMKRLVVANWKMQMTVRESVRAAKTFARRKWPADIEIAIAPSYLALSGVGSALRGAALQLAAQDASLEQRGALTGEVSPQDLKELGVRYVLVGHSERRRLFLETDALVARKLQAVADAGLIPILCVGETREERESGRVREVISRQIFTSLPKNFPKQGLVIAYEPVWAIGTGKAATPSDASAVHRDIAALLEKRFGKAADACRILYGGSVDAKNAVRFAAEERVDGFLVGGASLKAESFTALVRSCFS